MDSQTIRTALGKLQGEPYSEEAWSALFESVNSGGGDLALEELQRLLAVARERHAGRGEWDAVARLLEAAVGAAKETPLEAELLREQARVLKNELYDDEAALVPYQRLLALSEGDQEASEAAQELESKRGRAPELAQRYLDEAQTATDDTYRSSMLMHAAEMDVR